MRRNRLRGHHSSALRLRRFGAQLDKRGIRPAIPYRSTINDKPKFLPKPLFKRLARIEQTIGKMKRFKRLVLRCEKTARN
jgi:hypothetical protein